MKHTCDIIRDLMPLCMEDTASQQSRNAVAEHVAECADCHDIFEEMKKTIPEETRPADFRSEIRLIRRARHARRWRRIMAWILALTVAVVAALETANKLRNEWTRPLNASEYSMTLSRRENGDVVLVTRQFVPYQVHHSLAYDNDSGVMTYKPFAYLWPREIDEDQLHYVDRYEPFIWVDGEGLCIEHMRWDDTVPAEESTMYRLCTPVAEVWSGGTLIYRAGDEIPLASPELEQYMANFDDMTQSRDEYWAQWDKYAQDRTQEHVRLERYPSLADEQAALKNAMPELQ